MERQLDTHTHTRTCGSIIIKLISGWHNELFASNAFSRLWTAAHYKIYQNMKSHTLAHILAHPHIRMYTLEHPLVGLKCKPSA